MQGRKVKNFSSFDLFLRWEDQRDAPGQRTAKTAIGLEMGGPEGRTRAKYDAFIEKIFTPLQFVKTEL